jgi:type VI protein secretion system component VasF
VIVDVFAERRWEQADNEAIAAVAAEHPDTVAVAQWHAAIQDHIDELAQDRIHPGDAAAARYVQAVDEALAGLGVTVVG